VRNALELVVVDEKLRTAVGDDIAQIVRGESRVQRDQDRPGERHAVVSLQQRVGVGGEHGDTCAVPYAHVVQGTGEPQAPFQELGVGETDLAVDHGKPVGVHLPRSQQE
jgi:hypothetical protein